LIRVDFSLHTRVTLTSNQSNRQGAKERRLFRPASSKKIQIESVVRRSGSAEFNTKLGAKVWVNGKEYELAVGIIVDTVWLGVIFASRGLYWASREDYHASHGEKHFALAKRGREPGWSARSDAGIGYEGRRKLAGADGVPLSG
jgi:hypothetical protein